MNKVPCSRRTVIVVTFPVLNSFQDIFHVAYQASMYNGVVSFYKLKYICNKIS